MPNADPLPTEEPLRVSILSQGGYLVASIHTALDDTQFVRFREELIEQVGRQRSRGVVIDVAALDVIDSFACHTLRTLAQVARLRGAEIVVVGIRPDVAAAMVHLGAALDPTHTALDLEEGLAHLGRNLPGHPFWRGSDR